MENVSAADLAQALAQGEVRVIDVRERYEYEAGHVPGAIHVPLHLVPLRKEEFGGTPPVHVICESGNRSWQAAAFLQRQGISVRNVEGGMSAWRRSGQQVVAGA